MAENPTQITNQTDTINNQEKARAIAEAQVIALKFEQLRHETGYRFSPDVKSPESVAKFAEMAQLRTALAELKTKHGLTTGEIEATARVWSRETQTKERNAALVIAQTAANELAKLEYAVEGLMVTDLLKRSELPRIKELRAQLASPDIMKWQFKHDEIYGETDAWKATERAKAKAEAVVRVVEINQRLTVIETATRGMETSPTEQQVAQLNEGKRLIEEKNRLIRWHHIADADLKAPAS